MRLHNILRSKYQVPEAIYIYILTFRNTKRNTSLLNYLFNTRFIKPKILYFIGKKYIKNTCTIKIKYENTTAGHVNPPKNNF